MRKAKERIIFDNYNLWETYAEDATENLIYNGIKEPSEYDIWNEIYDMSYSEWDNTFYELEDFFDGRTWIAFGCCDLWNGSKDAGTIFTDFEKFFYKAIKDCNYWKIYDVNGHLYFECSHHDGTNFYEIKRLTEKGVQYIENWEYNWNDTRTEQYVHNKLVEKYSTLPRYAEKMWGCPKVEYEKETA